MNEQNEDKPQEIAQPSGSALNELLSVSHLNISDVFSRISGNMIAQKDAIIMDLITAKLGYDGFEVTDLVGRGEFFIDSNGYETFVFDGQELVQFHPVLFWNDKNTTTMHTSQSYKLL